MKKNIYIFSLLLLLSCFSKSYSQYELWGWGSNRYGQLGIGQVGPNANPTPIKINIGKDWSKLSAGSSFSMAIKTDGTLWAWGLNNNGQLGIGDLISRDTIVQVGIDKDWNKIACGGGHILAIKTDGTLWAWGQNLYGDIGDGTIIDRQFPTKIGNDNIWKDIACGADHSTAIKTDGTMWGWGLNENGEVGDGTSINRQIPTQIGSENNWESITCSQYHSYALKSNGTLWAWGDNEFGYLGTGDSMDRHLPVQIGIQPDWKIITTGHGSFGIKTDGTLWAWGYSDAIGTGDKFGKDYLFPVQIGNKNDWSKINSGYYQTMAIKNDGSLTVIGFNIDGELGDGTKEDKTIFTPIEKGKQWESAVCGDNHTIALRKVNTDVYFEEIKENKLIKSYSINQLNMILTLNLIPNINHLDIKIYDVLGNERTSLTSNNQEINININSLISGFYILNVMSENQSQTVKFIW